MLIHHLELRLSEVRIGLDKKYPSGLRSGKSQPMTPLLFLPRMKGRGWVGAAMMEGRSQDTGGSKMVTSIMICDLHSQAPGLSDWLFPCGISHLPPFCLRHTYGTHLSYHMDVSSSTTALCLSRLGYGTCHLYRKQLIQHHICRSVQS